MPPIRRGSGGRSARLRGGASVRDRLNFSAKNSPTNTTSKPSQQQARNSQNQYKYSRFRGSRRGSDQQISYQSSSRQQRSSDSSKYPDPEKQWHKITAYSCAHVGKDLVIKLIRDYVTSPEITKESNSRLTRGPLSLTEFRPYHIQEEGTSIVFYICGAKQNNAILSWKNQIRLPNQTILKFRSEIKFPPLIDLKNPEIIALVQSVMNKRYNGAERSLDLSAFRLDQTFIDAGLYVPISRDPIFECVIKMIRDNNFMEQNLFKLSLADNELKSLHHLSLLAGKCLALRIIDLSDNQIDRAEIANLKDFTLDDLRMAGNPICRSFDSAADYVSFMRGKLERLARLDGHELPVAIGFDVGSTQLPPKLGNFVPDNVKQIVELFIVQYYKLFDLDNEDRSSSVGATNGRLELAAGYHPDAMFSMSVIPPETSNSNTSQNKSQRPQTSMENLMQENRNILKISNSGERQRLLRRKRENIVSTFAKLPKTHHILETFLVDVPLVVSEPISLMKLVINGLFKDMSRSSTSLRAFTRFFTILPQPDGNGLLIFNDLWLIQSPSNDHLNHYNSLIKAQTPQATPNASSALMQQQQQFDNNLQMQGQVSGSFATNHAQELAIQLIMKETRMNRGFSYKLLSEEHWQTAKALELFMQLYNANSIPQEAFQPDH